MDNGVRWIAISRSYRDVLLTTEAILCSIKEPEEGKCRLYWEDITSGLDRMDVPAGPAAGMIFTLGAEVITQGEYEIDPNRIFAKYPHLDFYSAMAASLFQMADEGYLRLHMQHESGWIFEVSGSEEVS